MSTVLQSLSTELAAAVESAGRAIVAIHARRRIPASGVHWRPGVIVATHHTINREEGITVTLPDGTTGPATLAGRDPSTDLAVLRLSDPGLPTASPRPDAPKAGELVIALGRPGSSLTASWGVVSRVAGPWRTWQGAEIDTLLRLDLAIYDGFSGGPLIDSGARVLGINTSALARGAPLTIPVATVERVVTELLERGTIRRAYLGIGTQEVRVPCRAPVAGGGAVRAARHGGRAARRGRRAGERMEGPPVGGVPRLRRPGEQGRRGHPPARCPVRRELQSVLPRSNGRPARGRDDERGRSGGGSGRRFLGAARTLAHAVSPRDRRSRDGNGGAGGRAGVVRRAGRVLQLACSRTVLGTATAGGPDASAIVLAHLPCSRPWASLRPGRAHSSRHPCLRDDVRSATGEPLPDGARPGAGASRCRRPALHLHPRLVQRRSSETALSIQRGPCNWQNSSMLHPLMRTRVTRCWSLAFRMRGVAELRSHTRQVLRGAQL